MSLGRKIQLSPTPLRVATIRWHLSPLSSQILHIVHPSYPAVFGAVLLRSRRMLSVGLAKQNAEAVIHGYKGAKLFTEPAARALEDLELVDATEPVQSDRGAGAGGGGGADGGDGAVFGRLASR
jgi:hypothetical protein